MNSQMNSQFNSLESLKDLLKAEREACVRGDKTSYLVADPDLKAEMDAKFQDDPMYRFIGLEGFGQIWAYQDFRELVQQYQVEHGISAIEWYSVTIESRDFLFPRVAMEFNALPGDLEIMKTYKAAVLQAWEMFVQAHNPDCWMSENGGDVEVELQYIRRFAEQCEWAEISTHFNGIPELVLTLGWGDPNDAMYEQNNSGQSLFTCYPAGSFEKNWESVWACPIRW